MTNGSNAVRTGLGQAALEVLAAAVVFAAAGAWPVPDSNEAVYVTKARHWADPAWGRGDFFLESPDAHVVFCALYGPLAAAVPLETAAWIGRVIGWLAVAAGFRHAIAPLAATPWGRVAAAAIFSLALRYTTAAGEWVIGGCEAKVFSWALVLAGVGETLRGRFGPAWLLCGGAAAFHPVVGGWALVAVAAAWLVDGRVRADDAPPPGVSFATIAWLVAGTAIAACGILPALRLSADADAATRAAAAAIYVVERLPHHLLPRTFAAGLVARHLLAIAVWWLLERMLPVTAARRRLATLVGAALALSLTGWIVSLAEPLVPEFAHAILRFYWFRIADVLVALALAAAVVAVLGNDTACRALLPVPPAVVRVMAASLLALDLAAESAHWPLPDRAALQSRADKRMESPAWEDACAWVRDHTPTDACFLTPHESASFVWRTGRREVVSRKNSPQDARSLVEWRRRIVDCFSRDGEVVNLESSTASLGAARMLEVADRYNADHAIVPLTACGLESLPFPRLYANTAYAVVRLSPLTAQADPAAPP